MRPPRTSSRSASVLDPRSLRCVPSLVRPDGVELYWEQAGDSGPLILVSLIYGMPRGTLSGLVEDLAHDHRVVGYDLRGTGRSTREGPYDMATDVADLQVLAEAAGAGAVSVAVGDGGNRAVHAAAGRPDLIEAVVISGSLLLGGPDTVRGSDALVASSEVLQGIVTLYEADYRSGAHQVIASGSPYLSEEEIRQRVDRAVENSPQEATLARLRGWIEDDPADSAAELGDRLGILSYEGNLWFPDEVPERVRQRIPEANVEPVADGAVTRPDLTAAVVRRITARRAVG
jgi:pimeloyl-ACP methyl ester carboxylesterase